MELAIGAAGAAGLFFSTDYLYCFSVLASFSPFAKHLLTGCKIIIISELIALQLLGQRGSLLHFQPENPGRDLG
jgi:hypothetical protein